MRKPRPTPEPKRAALWRRLLPAVSAVGGLFAFASPATAQYPVLSSEAMKRAAWERVGGAMRGAMGAHREELAKVKERRR